jgi:hypothetical protein
MMDELEGNSLWHCLEAEVVYNIYIYVKGYGFKFCRYSFTLEQAVLTVT